MIEKHRRMAWLLVGVLALIGIWFLGDYAYSEVVARSVERWEASIERDADGVQNGAQTYQLAGSNNVQLILVHGFNDTPQAFQLMAPALNQLGYTCLLYTSPSPRDQRGSRMPSSA